MPNAATPKSPNGEMHDRPALATQDVCPNCGRGPAVVFAAPSDCEPGEDGQPKLVCFFCCPKPADS
jgi:hypothetical protein